MKNKHIFISAIDVGEQLPFAVKQKKNLQESFKEQDRARKALDKFILQLEKYFNESVFYLGLDVIGEKSYERFMFKGSGFFEVMVEAPVAFNAHFPNKKRAVSFLTAIKKTIEKQIPASSRRDMFMDSLEVQDEKDDSLTVDDWNKMKEIR